MALQYDYTAVDSKGWTKEEHNLAARFAWTMMFIDMNEITMNLVPFPKLHFLQSSLSPLYNLINPKILPRNIDQSFADAFNRDNCLI